VTAWPGYGGRRRVVVHAYRRWLELHVLDTIDAGADLDLTQPTSVADEPC
jgi:hypothetical protein